MTAKSNYATRKREEAIERKRKREEEDRWFDSLTKEERLKAIDDKITALEANIAATANHLRDCGEDKNKQRLNRLSGLWNEVEEIRDEYITDNSD